MGIIVKKNIATFFLLLFPCSLSWGESIKLIKREYLSKSVSVASEAPEAEMKKSPEEFGYFKEMKVEEAVAEFNLRALSNRIGKTQPPLSAEEVLTAIRSWEIGEEPIDRNVFGEFQKISKSGLFPKGAYIDFFSGYNARNGHDIEAWIIFIKVRLNQNYDMEQDERPLYSHKIRMKFISSKPTKFNN